MKANLWSTRFWAALLAFGIAFGGELCLMTAFSLNGSRLLLGLCCGGAAILSAFVSRKKFALPVQLAAILFVGLVCWRWGLAESAKALIARLSAVYDMAYGWGRVLEDYAESTVPVSFAMAFLGGGIVCVVTDAVSRRRPCFGAVFTGLCPLFACSVVTDRVPSEGSLFVLASGLLLLILTHTVRRREERDGNRLTAILLIPALLCAALLFWAVPQSGYTPPSFPSELLQEWFGGGEGTGEQSGAPDQTVDLTNVGPKSQARYTVMNITASALGKIYLRGQSFDSYTGKNWAIGPDPMGKDPYWPTAGLKNGEKLTVTLLWELDARYLPYFCQELSQLTYGSYENDESKSYTVQQRVPTENGPILQIAVRQDTLTEQCLLLPESTRAWAVEYLQKLELDGLTQQDKAAAIAAHVQGAAEYNKNTEKMPAGQEDFARWFLENGEEGYCVHFATAATVLLRAAGIPARYVTGYLTEIGSGVTAVMADESHSWVEYLDGNQGWTVLDPTPIDLENISTEPTETVLPTETAEPTEASTEPTEASVQTTAPTEESTAVSALPTEPTGGGEETESSLLKNGLLAICLAIGMGLAIWGQYVLRVRLRRRRHEAGGPNQRALKMWRDIARFSRRYGRELPVELAELAEKAKFSQYTLTAEEENRFRTGLAELRAALREKPWYQRIFWMLIFAAE